MITPPLLEAIRVSRSFGRVSALRDVSISVSRGEVVCLLGDNGAGKSTLIKILSGRVRPDSGEIRVDGERVTLANPREALRLGLSTVYQDLAVLPKLSVARNFCLGNEPTVGWGPLRRFDARTANATASDALRSIGVNVSDPSRLAGTLSGGERQSLAIARAEYRGARVLILDEPTSALGVHEAGVVLKHVLGARARDLGVILITHNLEHALPVGDTFVILSQGEVVGRFSREEADQRELQHLMGGGRELDGLRRELEALRAHAHDQAEVSAPDGVGGRR
jgi:simple sugar transport system ATP-binding protein